MASSHVQQPPPARFVISETRPGRIYRVTPVSCECDSFRFQKRGHRFPCKHMIREFFADPGTAVREAPALPLPALHCWCVRCGTLYEFTEDARLLCPDCAPVTLGHGWDRANSAMRVGR